MYLSESATPGVERLYDVIDARTGDVIPYVKSVDISLGILEEVVFAGRLSNGRPRPLMRYGKLVTRTRFASFHLVAKGTRTIIYSSRG